MSSSFPSFHPPFTPFLYFPLRNIYLCLQAPEAAPGDPDGGLSHLAGYLQSNHLGHSSNRDFPYLFIFKENKVPLSGNQAKGI